MADFIDDIVAAQARKAAREADTTSAAKYGNSREGQKIAVNESNDGMPFKTTLDEVGEYLVDTPHDQSDHGQGNLKNRLRQFLVITHVPTGFGVAFPAFIDTFNDAFTSGWTQESVYGRMDPIATFNSTERVLSLGWHVPAVNYEAAEKNLGDINQLISYLYPMYDGGFDLQGAAAINQSPLVRIKFGNLVVSSVSGDGLLGYCRGLTFDPALEHGMFHETTATGPRYFPKTYRLNLELKVLHDHRLGFKVADEQKKDVIIPTRADTSEAGKIKYHSKIKNTFTTSYSFNDEKVSWNNFPYHTDGGTDSANRSTSTQRILEKKTEEAVPTNPIFENMFNRERLGTVNIMTALRFGNINQEEANILLRGSNIVEGVETTPEGDIMDYRNTGMNPDSF